MPGKAGKEDAAEAHPDSALEVGSFDSVTQRVAAQGSGRGGLHPNHIKMRLSYNQQQI
jgi:hypothetical protein